MTNLINKKLFLAALSCLTSGYAIMALAPIPFLRMTVSPIMLIVAFILIVLSILKPSIKKC